MNRILDIFFRLLTRLFLITCRLRFSRTIRSSSSERKKIAAFPYGPKGWPGGNERIANWKAYFEKDNIQFDVFWASDEKEYLEFLKSKSAIVRYRYFLKILYRRYKTITKLKEYDAIWVQRAFIPTYPYKSAYFEQLIGKIHPNLIMDYYDADYDTNYTLTIECVQAANKVSVSTEFLKQYFSPFNSNVFQINMTIDHNLYKEICENDKLVIGWMGNEGNLPHLYKLKDVFQKIETKYPEVKFHFLCREKKKFDLNNLNYSSFNDKNFDYFNWLSGIDIGLAPYLDDSDVQKAKSPMKTLEYLSSKIPMVSSKYGAFPGMNHNEHFMLANSESDWFECLSTLIEDKGKRKKLSDKGKDFMLEQHTYSANYNKLKSIFFDDI